MDEKGSGGEVEVVISSVKDIARIEGLLVSRGYGMVVGGEYIRRGTYMKDGDNRIMWYPKQRKDLYDD